jgi:L-seryl-tRNA(Ser) seleniumtransferase
MTHSAASAIPSLDSLLKRSALQGLISTHGRRQVVNALRLHLAALREAALAQQLDPLALDEARIAAHLATALGESTRTRLVPVINLTGTVLHTNLGRAPLPQAAAAALLTAAVGPVTLEYDLEQGGRGERDRIIEPLLRELTGAASATVVNNNAAAVLLMLAALAPRGEVIVSRGELIEIGGSFRIPDIMRQARVRLVEVGTTNRTHLSDYAAAIGPRTALLMKVHPSNYAIQGFTHAVPAQELAVLARQRSLPLITDLGSGTLLDLTRYGLPHEPTVQESLAAGADLVSFSGDKLMGGPQAGLIAGRADLIARLRQHPLRRALRPGKLTLAALEAVLALYRDPETLAQRLTTLRHLTRPPAAMRAQALRLAPAFAMALGGGFAVTDAPLSSQIGSGALPVEQLPSHGLAIRARDGHGVTDLARRLRALPHPVLGRITDDTLWLDVRCLAESEEPELLRQLQMLTP